VHAILAGTPPDDPAPEAVELADRFFVSALGKQVARAQTKNHEWDFQFDAGDMILRGQIDLWFEYNRDVVIVDYKTDREVTEESIAGHSMQLQLYTIALERATGRRATRAVLYFLRSNEPVEVDLTPLAIGGAQEVVHRFRSAQTQMDFPLHTGRHCFSCEFYRGLCPAGQNTAASAD
jgi:CRISPR/Cas system-associated exonuclease Cas4 (RecB family)